MEECGERRQTDYRGKVSRLRSRGKTAAEGTCVQKKTTEVEKENKRCTILNDISGTL